jgi:hypothetical protein
MSWGGGVVRSGPGSDSTDIAREGPAFFPRGLAFVVFPVFLAGAFAFD